MSGLISCNRLHELLRYDPDTGIFFWRNRRGRVAAGAVAGMIKEKDGFCYIQIDGKERLAHHLARLYMTGEWPQSSVTHANGNRSDNRSLNLIEASGDGDWRDIPGFPGYQASFDGRIRSLRNRTPLTLKPDIDKDGYSRVQVSDATKRRHIGVHRAVALAFHGPAPTVNSVACHNDGTRSNNAAANLRWDTQLSNIADKRTHGTHQIGSKHPRAICDETRAAEARRLLGTGLSLRQAADTLGLSYHIIADINRGRTWKTA